jgi:peroxiredoxin
MRLKPPSIAPRLAFTDIYGKTTTIGGATGRRTLLCFFRDASCPFCNFRIYELTNRHDRLAKHGLDIIAVFAATPERVKRFAARKPRPFTVIADPAAASHDAYGIQRSLLRKLKAIVTRVPTLLRGMRIVGLAGLNTNNLLPADFLIDEDGRIVDSWYGRDAGDRIPFERVESFAAEQGSKAAPAVAA